MKKALILVLNLIILTSNNLLSQNEVDSKIAELIKQDQYETIISDYANNNLNLYSAKSLYNIGFSYYMLNNDSCCLKYMDLTIKKDSLMAAAYFTKGATYTYMNKLEEAIPFLEKAISLETDSSKLAHSYRYLGFSFYHLNKVDSAIKTYQKAIINDKENALPYIMIAQLYSDSGKEDKALECYYLGRKNSSNKYVEYSTILFNIGLYEQLKGNYKEAEIAYKELIETSPTDYHAYAKLIQVYNHNKEYDKIVPLKDVLYTAHEEGLIKDENLEDMFCIDQFTHNGKQIRVYERYEDGHSKNIYYKIIFYILDANEEIDYQIQTEYSPAAVAFGEGKYMLCANKDGTHINYGIGFGENPSYESIKNTVIKILDKEK